MSHILCGKSCNYRLINWIPCVPKYPGVHLLSPPPCIIQACASSIDFLLYAKTPIIVHPTYSVTQNF